MAKSLSDPRSRFSYPGSRSRRRTGRAAAIVKLMEDEGRERLQLQNYYRICGPYNDLARL